MQYNITGPMDRYTLGLAETFKVKILSVYSKMHSQELIMEDMI
jgi:hypothetical protein